VNFSNKYGVVRGKNRLIIKQIYLFLIFSIVLHAQTGGISGYVSDGSSPVPSVNIIITGTTTGTVTNFDGYFKFSSLEAGNYNLKFSSVGYETKFLDVDVIPGKIIEVKLTMREKAIEVGEVKVTGDRIQEVSDTRTSLIDVNPTSAKVLPGAVEDVLRTLQSLPGVLAPNDFSSQLIIRGSGPDQNLIIIDDVEVFNPYRLYGAISMFNPDVISDINLITGGFPAKYGDRLSAVLDVTNREGDKARNLKGSLNASILSANAVLEGKNPFNLTGSWLFNSRRTYYDLIIEPFVKNTGLVEENVNFPSFYDIQGKLVFGPFDGHKFQFLGIYSEDGVNVVSGKERETPDSIAVNNLTKNQVFSGSWQYASKRSLINKITLSWYNNSGGVDFNSQILDPSLNREDFEGTAIDSLSPYLLGVRFQNEFLFRKFSIDDKLLYFWGKHELEAGAGFDRIETTVFFNIQLDPQLQAIFAANPNARSALSGLKSVQEYFRYRVYAQNTFNLFDRLFINPGIRIDHYQILEKTYFAPRFGFSYAIDDITTMRGVWGIYYQSPGYEKVLDQGILYDLNRKNTIPLEAEKATHYVLGVERWLTSEWNLKIEGYYKKFSNLIVPLRIPGTGYYTEQIPGGDPRYATGWTTPVKTVVDSVTQIPTNGTSGEAFGIELLLGKKNINPDSKLNGWISYSLAFANRFDRGTATPFVFDRRHNFNLVLNYTFCRIWDVGVRWQYGTGFPYTEPTGVKPRIVNGQIATRGSFFNPTNQEVIYDVGYGDRTRYNSRKPDYQRLDIRVSAYTRFWNADWNFYLDVINVYNYKNVVGYNYYVDKNLTLQRETNTMLPILPTLGFSVKF